MTIDVLRAKLHRITITEANVDYIGSITLDQDLVDASGLVEGEKVQVLNVNNGNRLETYVILGKRGTGEVCLNGPAALRASVGDVVIVIAYARMTVEEARAFRPTVVFPDERTNRLKP
jgi:aspartate 1-decarboxylase